MQRLGITTTVPVEIILAAGAIPVDLNNIFITARDRSAYIARAEHDGYPRNVCAWIKGMYGVVASGAGIDSVIAVTEGDCSNTHALMETLRLVGVPSIPFAYPFSRERISLEREMIFLADTLGTTLRDAERERGRLEPVRRDLDVLDDLLWRENRVTGDEHHLWHVSSSDFNGDVEVYARELAEFIAGARTRKPLTSRARLAYIGVPPILDDIYETIREFGGRVVMNEVQRQFAMPERGGDIVEQYRAYTYPYGVFHRLDYISREIARRDVDGVVHYVQSFCHRHIEDMVVRRMLDVPVLTIEGEAPGTVDARTKIRIQAFIEMLEGR